MDQILQTASKSKQKGTMAAIAIFVVLGFVCIFALIPFYFMLVSSFKSGMELVRNGINIDFPIEKFTLNGYLSLFTNRDGIYFSWYKNSFLITLFQTACAIFFSAMVGYGLAVYRFKGRNLIFVLVLVVMMVPIEILILPLYQLINNSNI